jgi:hypothetical protein
MLVTIFFYSLDPRERNEDVCIWFPKEGEVCVCLCVVICRSFRNLGKCRGGMDKMDKVDVTVYEE